MTAGAARLVLVGGGHAHLEVLRRLAGRDAPPVDLTLVSLDDRHHYSGMVPGYLAGIYEEDDLSVPLVPLAERTGGRFVRAEVLGIDPGARRLEVREGEAGRAESIGYDFVSFDVGSLAAGWRRPDVARHARSVKPIGRAAALRGELDALAVDGGVRGPARVVVVGGGAAGVEVAFAVAHRLDQLGRLDQLDQRGPRVTLVESGGRILAGSPSRVRERARRLLARRSIHVETGRRVAEVREDRAMLEGGRELPTDLTIWLTGPAAPPLFAGSGLPLDDRGFLLVGPSLRSTGASGDGDPRVFGAGDCVTLSHAPGTPKAGVHAVKEGPVLYESLRAALGGPDTPSAGVAATPPLYRPQRRFLSLLNTCDGRALLSWKGFAAYGRWAWWLKDSIDRGFVRKYR